MRLRTLLVAAAATLLMAQDQLPEEKRDAPMERIAPEPLPMKKLYSILGIDPDTCALTITCRKVIRNCPSIPKENPDARVFLTFTFRLYSVTVQDTSRFVTFEDDDADGMLDSFILPSNLEVNKNFPGLDPMAWELAQKSYTSMLGIVPLCLGFQKSSQ